MSENSKNILSLDDDDDIIPDMSDPYWVARFEKATLTCGRPKSDTPEVSPMLPLQTQIRAKP